MTALTVRIRTDDGGARTCVDRHDRDRHQRQRGEGARRTAAGARSAARATTRREDRKTHPPSHSPSQFCSLTFSLSSRFPLTRTQAGAGTGSAIREVAAVLLTGLERRPGRRRIHCDGCRRRTRRHVVRAEVHRADGAPAPARSTAARARGPRARAEHRPVGAGSAPARSAASSSACRPRTGSTSPAFRPTSGACNPRVDALRPQRRSKSE